MTIATKYAPPNASMPASIANEEMLRFLSFVDQIDSEAEADLHLPHPKPYYRMSIFLLRQHLEAKLVTVTALAAFWIARMALFTHSAGTPSFSNCRAFMMVVAEVRRLRSI